MDKLTPTYQLDEIKTLIEKGQCELTINAERFAHSLGFSATEVFDIAFGLERGNFYKSVTERRNHKVWQDVYKKRVRGRDLYVKLKITSIGERIVLILSFKEDGNVGEKP